MARVARYETTFVYDADGDRLIRRDSAGNAALFMDNTEIRADTSGATGGTRYYSGDAVRVDGALTWLASDHHGTGTVAVRAADLSVTRRRLDPYGNHRGDAVEWPGEKGFVGATQDPTGLIHLGAREYDPVIGRFISVDPLFDQDDPQSMQGYAYANNNPTSFSDPDGEALIGDSQGRCRAYKKYKYYKKRGGGYKKRGAGYTIRDWRAKNRNKVAKKRAAAQKREAAAKKKRQAAKKRAASKKAAKKCTGWCKAATMYAGGQSSGKQFLAGSALDVGSAIIPGGRVARSVGAKPASAYRFVGRGAYKIYLSGGRYVSHKRSYALRQAASSPQLVRTWAQNSTAQFGLVVGNTWRGQHGY